MILLIQLSGSLQCGSGFFIAVSIGFTATVTIAPIALYNSNRLIKRERSKLSDIFPEL